MAGIGTTVTRKGVGRAPPSGLTEFLLRGRARVGSGSPEWGQCGPQAGEGGRSGEMRGPEGQAWVFFSVLFTCSLFLSLH